MNRNTKKLNNYVPGKKIGVLIPCHNEEKYVGKAIQSVQNCNYPQELVDIIIILDHCTDRTEEIARKNHVHIITNIKNKGKGYAVDTAIRAFQNQYDAFFILDADCTVAKDTLQYFAKDIEEGVKIVQFPILRKNIYQNEFTLMLNLGHLVQDFFYFKGKQLLKLPIFLSGSGFGFITSICDLFLQDHYGVAEDLEISVKLILNGIYPEFNFHSYVLTQQPSSKEQAIVQQTRWASGSLKVIFSTISLVFIHFLKNPGWVSLDLFLSLISWQRVYFALALAVYIFLGLVFQIFSFNMLILLCAIFLLESVYMFSGIYFFSRRKHHLKKIFFYAPKFVVWYTKIKILGLLNLKNNSWVRTPRH
jgi:hypothetical protein